MAGKDKKRRKKYIVEVLSTRRTFFVVEAYTEDDAAMWADSSGEDMLAYLGPCGDDHLSIHTVVGDVVTKKHAKKHADRKVDVDKLMKKPPAAILDEDGDEAWESDG